jgi:hypothetical protein
MFAHNQTYVPAPEPAPTPLPVNNTWQGGTYGNGKWLFVGSNNSNVVYTTNRGSTWTTGTCSISNALSVAYGNGKFVAVGAGTRFSYSSDGTTWANQVGSQLNLTWSGIAYGDGKFIAVGATSDKYSYSTDGINWSQGIFPFSANWTAITYANGLWVAIYPAGTSGGAYSTDGINWTTVTVGGVNMDSIAGGNGYFVTAGTGSIAYSTNGSSWTVKAVAVNPDTLQKVGYGNGRFVITATNSNTVYWSNIPSGTWYRSALPNASGVTPAWFTPVYGDAIATPGWVVTGYYNSGSNSLVAASIDGQTWT